MSTPTVNAPAEHIDVVARVIDPGAFHPSAAMSTLPEMAHDAARDLLDSTDPRVHAAMRDALTRHGVLP